MKQLQHAQVARCTKRFQRCRKAEGFRSDLRQLFRQCVASSKDGDQIARQFRQRT
jgi:hypothetical protein